MWTSASIRRKECRVYFYWRTEATVWEKYVQGFNKKNVVITEQEIRN